MSYEELRPNRLYVKILSLRDKDPSITYDDICSILKMDRNHLTCDSGIVLAYDWLSNNLPEIIYDHFNVDTKSIIKKRMFDIGFINHMITNIFAVLEVYCRDENEDMYYESTIALICELIHFCWSHDRDIDDLYDVYHMGKDTVFIFTDKTRDIVESILDKIKNKLDESMP